MSFPTDRGRTEQGSNDRAAKSHAIVICPSGTSLALGMSMATATHSFQRAYSAGAIRTDSGGRGRQAMSAREAAVVLVTTPVIYSLLVPLALLDVCVTVYQRICFPAYGIERVRRRGFFTIDRHTLPYLSLLARMNCTYCSYANGVLAYTREVAARTETYWCPIKHARPIRDPHARYHSFLEFGDATGYRRQLRTVRRTLIQPGKRGRRAA